MSDNNITYHAVKIVDRGGWLDIQTGPGRAFDVDSVCDGLRLPGSEKAVIAHVKADMLVFVEDNWGRGDAEFVQIADALNVRWRYESPREQIKRLRTERDELRREVEGLRATKPREATTE